MIPVPTTKQQGGVVKVYFVGGARVIPKVGLNCMEVGICPDPPTLDGLAVVLDLTSAAVLGMRWSIFLLGRPSTSSSRREPREEESSSRLADIFLGNGYFLGVVEV